MESMWRERRSISPWKSATISFTLSAGYRSADCAPPRDWAHQAARGPSKGGGPQNAAYDSQLQRQRKGNSGGLSGCGFRAEWGVRIGAHVTHGTSDVEVGLSDRLRCDLPAITGRERSGQGS